MMRSKLFIKYVASIRSKLFIKYMASMRIKLLNKYVAWKVLRVRKIRKSNRRRYKLKIKRSGRDQVRLVPSSIGEDVLELPIEPQSQRELRYLEVCRNFPFRSEDEDEKRPSPPDVTRIYMRLKPDLVTYTKTLLLEIPSSELLEFSSKRLKENPTNCNFYYTPHDHYHSDQKPSSSIRFFEVLEDSPPFILACTIGSTWYVVDFGNDSEERNELRALELTLDSDLDSYSRRPRLLPIHNRTIDIPPVTPCWPVRMEEVFALCGRICIFSQVDDPNEPFGVVFDPEINKWSHVREPECPLPDNILIIPLGDSEGKFLFYPRPIGEKSCRNTPRIYDLLSDSWTEYSLPKLDSMDLYEVPLVVEEHSCFYWLCRRRAMINCYSWKKQFGFSAPIVGLEHEEFYWEGELPTPVRLVHVWDDLYCIMWSKIDDSSHVDPTTTYFHSTFIQLISKLGLVTAFVVGCYSHHMMHDQRCQYSVIDGFRLPETQLETTETLSALT